MNILPSFKSKPLSLTRVDGFDHQTFEIVNKIKELNIGNNFDINNYFNNSVSTLSRAVDDKNMNLLNRSRLIESRVVDDKNMDEMLFDATARVKIETSRVSMHLDASKIEKLFLQIDSIHDPEDWDEDLSAINLSSYQSFLMWYLLTKPDRGPGLGLTDSGNLVAAWMKENDRLILEFLPQRKAKWFVATYFDDEIETASGTALIDRLPAILSSYSVGKFFNRE